MTSRTSVVSLARRALLVSTVAVFALAACGKSTAKSSPTEVTTTAAVTTKAAGPVMAGDLKHFEALKDAKVVNCLPKSGPLMAAWVYVGTITDGGWTQAHDDGRKAVQDKFGDKVKTTYKESVPEGPEVATAVENLIKDGNTLIIGTSFGFQDAFLAVAAKHPDVCFEFATGYKNAPNMSQFYGAGEDTDFLAGMAAGAASKTGKLGFVAPFPIAEVIREVNAYALGAKLSNPKATVNVVWTNTWFDPAKERAAAESLIAAGMDTIGSGQDSPASGEAAKAKGLPWTGYDADQSKNFPDIWLTATNYHWGVYEIPRVQQILDGKWMAGNYYGGTGDGFVSLAPYGKLVSADTQKAIEAKLAELKAGTFDIFSGPLKDQKGTEKVKAGATLPYGDRFTMDYLVDNVVGDLPKS